MTSHILMSGRSRHGCSAPTKWASNDMEAVQDSRLTKNQSQTTAVVPKNMSISSLPPNCGPDAIRGVVTVSNHLNTHMDVGSLSSDVSQYESVTSKPATPQQDTTEGASISSQENHTSTHRGIKINSSNAQVSPVNKRCKFHLSSKQAAAYSVGTIYQSSAFQKFAQSTHVVDVGHRNLQKKIPHLKSRAIRSQWAIGQGSFGAVFCVTVTCPCCYGFAELQDGKLTPEHVYGGAQSGIAPHYVLKRLPNRLVQQQKDNRGSPNKELKLRYSQAVTDLILEVHVLAGLTHPNIIKVRGVASDDTLAEDFFFLMERLSCTLSFRIHHTWAKKQDSLMISSDFWNSAKLPCHLADVLKSSVHKKLDKLWVERITAARGIASALAYMHKERVMHRDIKPKNIGFDFGDDTIKLFDFGTAIQIPSDHPACLVHSGRVGSRRYMAPEVFSRQPYNESADVFSFVLVMWEMLSFNKPPDWNISPSFEEDVIVNKCPSDDGNTASTKSKSMLPVVEGSSRDRPCIPSSWSSGVRNALSLGWSFHPRDRLSASSYVKVLDAELKRCRKAKINGKRHWYGTSA